MKKHLSKTTLLTATILLSGWFWSCESKIPLDDDLINEPLSINQIKVNVADTTSVITIERAGEIASKFAKSNFTGSRSESREIGEVYSVKDSLGNASMYIVNFANSKGFVIVSANKGYYPVIAQSDVGHFNIPDSNHPASVWVKEQSQYISHCSELPSEIKADVARSWNEYASEEVLITCSRSDYPPIPQVYYDSLKMWTISGEYSGVYRYNDFIKTDEYRQLTDEEKQQMINNMHMYGNACYGPVEDVTIVLVRDIYYRADYPRQLMQTQWGQKEPYNWGLSDSNLYLGCSTIAVGQIMRYHEWPNSYNWTDMPTGYLAVTETTCRFLYDLTKLLKIRVSENGSPGKLSDVPPALIKLGYTVTRQNHKDSDVLRELTNNRPVYMYGADSDEHAWVCDGAIYHTTDHQVRVMSLEYRPTTYSPPPMIEVMNKTTRTSMYGPFFHMNWGGTGTGDGFFMDNNLDFVDGSGTIHNYKKNREDLIICPRK